MLAYHLTSEKYAFESIRLQRLKLALLEDMNDPFELMALEAPGPDDRKFFKQLKAEMNRSVGVLCFSRSCRNPVLWSHYADKHKGICLAFDIPDEHVLPIDYTPSRLKAELEHQPQPQPGQRDIAIRLITTKFKHWHYEEEVRLLYSLQDAQHEVKDGKDLHFVPYFPWLDLKEVVLGPRCELDVEAVRAQVKQHHPGIAVYRARLAFRSFAVVQDAPTWKKRFGEKK